MRKALTVLGITLVTIGLVSLAYQEVIYSTHGVLPEAGAAVTTAEIAKAVLLPPLLGALAVAGGRGQVLKYNIR